MQGLKEKLIKAGVVTVEQGARVDRAENHKRMTVTELKFRRDWLLRPNWIQSAKSGGSVLTVRETTDPELLEIVAELARRKK